MGMFKKPKSAPIDNSIPLAAPDPGQVSQTGGDDSAQQAQNAARSASGYNSTLLTGPTGIQQTQSSSGGKTLLGE